MAYVMTYNNLVLRVIDDLERNDQTVIDSMDSWIKFAHERIGRDCNTLLVEQYVTQNFVIGVPALNKPGRWQNTLSFRIGTGANQNTTTNIYLRSYEFCRLYSPDDTVLGQPKFYADYGYNAWLISPTPDAAYPYEICYMETPQVIDIAFQNNYFTEFMPEILLKAVLIEAMITLKNDERLDPLMKDYVALVASWNNKDVMTKTDRYSNRKAD